MSVNSKGSTLSIHYKLEKNMRKEANMSTSKKQNTRQAKALVQLFTHLLTSEIQCIPAESESVQCYFQQNNRKYRPISIRHLVYLLNCALHFDLTV